MSVSTDGSDVDSSKKWTTKADRNTFEEAIAAAQAVADKAEATQDEVDQAKLDLEAAVTVYEGKQAQGNN